MKRKTLLSILVNILSGMAKAKPKKVLRGSQSRFVTRQTVKARRSVLTEQNVVRRKIPLDFNVTLQ